MGLPSAIERQLSDYTITVPLRSVRLFGEDFVLMKITRVVCFEDVKMLRALDLRLTVEAVSDRARQMIEPIVCGERIADFSLGSGSMKEILGIILRRIEAELSRVIEKQIVSYGMKQGTQAALNAGMNRQGLGALVDTAQTLGIPKDSAFGAALGGLNSGLGAQQQQARIDQQMSSMQASLMKKSFAEQQAARLKEKEQERLDRNAMAERFLKQGFDEMSRGADRIALAEAAKRAGLNPEEILIPVDKEERMALDARIRGSEKPKLISVKRPKRRIRFDDE